MGAQPCKLINTKQYPLHVNEPDKEGNRPLCRASSLDMLQSLLRNGANPFLCNYQKQWPYQHYPLDSEIRQYLLNYTLFLTIIYTSKHLDKYKFESIEIFDQLLRDGARLDFSPTHVPAVGSSTDKLIDRYFVKLLNKTRTESQ